MRHSDSGAVWHQAYRALVATAYTGDVMIELVQPFNDEPSPHNDWLRGGGPHGDGE